MSSKKPQDQSNEEWLADYDGRDYEERGVTLISRTFPVNQTSPIPNIDGFVGRYIDHRTIAVGRGCVALDFEDINTNIIATAFFNVIRLAGSDAGAGAATAGENVGVIA